MKPTMASKLAHYVYAYVDPRDSSIFYVGKGYGGRALFHLKEIGESAKNLRIAEIRSAGYEPLIEILAHGISDNDTALNVEMAIIGALGGPKALTNRSRGKYSSRYGRKPLKELAVQYNAEPVAIAEPVMLIRINKLFRPDMTEEALFEATRGIWTCGVRREKARYGFAVFEGVIREVYEIHEWHPGGTLEYRTRGHNSIYDPKRWEFSGVLDSVMSAKYTGKSVERYFKPGAQLPFSYVNC